MLAVGHVNTWNADAIAVVCFNLEINYAITYAGFCNVVCRTRQHFEPASMPHAHSHMLLRTNKLSTHKSYHWNACRLGA